jgi:hypothetical protein
MAAISISCVPSCAMRATKFATSRRSTLHLSSCTSHDTQWHKDVTLVGIALLSGALGIQDRARSRREGQCVILAAAIRGRMKIAGCLVQSQTKLPLRTSHQAAMTPCLDMVHASAACSSWSRGRPVVGPENASQAALAALAPALSWTQAGCTRPAPSDSCSVQTTSLLQSAELTVSHGSQHSQGPPC